MTSDTHYGGDTSRAKKCVVYVQCDGVKPTKSIRPLLLPYPKLLHQNMAMGFVALLGLT